MILIWALLVALVVPSVDQADAALVFYWRAEGTTLSGTDDYTAGDTTATANNSVTLDAAAGVLSGNGILSDASAEHYRFDSTSILSAAAGSVGMWVRWTTATNGSGITQFRGTDSTNWVRTTIASTDEIQLSIRVTGGSTVTITTTAVNIATSTDYFVTWSWDDAADLRRLCVYNSSLVLVEACTTSSSAFTGPTELALDGGIQLGEFVGTAIGLHLDNIFIGNAYADADTFLDCAEITSYTEYATCSTGGSTARNLMLLGVGQ